MEDRHLLNTIAMLKCGYRRRMLALCLSALSYAGSAPDGAAMAAEQAAEEAMDHADSLDKIEDEFPMYAVLLAEAKWRGLKP